MSAIDDDRRGSETAVQDTLHAVRSAAESGDPVRVGEILDALGNSSQAATLLIPAVLCATPLSGIPGVSMACGILIFIISVQMVANRDHLWLPDWALRRTVPAKGLEKWIDRIMPVARFLDRWTAPRLTFLLHRPLVWVPRIVCMLCGMAMPALELVPTSSSILATAVAIIATGLLARDGLLLVLSSVFIGGTIWVVLTVL